MDTSRPYYDAETFQTGSPAVFRPGLGVVDEHGRTIASKIARSSSFSTRAAPSVGLHRHRPLVHYDAQRGYADLELVEYFDVANVGELVKSLVQSLVRNYAKVLVAQPFEVARLLLQVGDISTETVKVAVETEQEDEEEVEYFQPRDEVRRRTRVKRPPSATPAPHTPTQVQVPTTTTAPMPSTHLSPVSLNTVDVMSAMLSQEGARGLWRAANTTFVYKTLNATLEAWITGFASAFLHIPDPFFVDIAHSPEPTTTLLLSLSASVLTGLILAPLDLIRTRMIVTRINNSERSLRNSIQQLKFFTCPLSLVIPTVLNSLANNLLKKITPYLLLVKLGIDSGNSPSLYGTLSLVASIAVLAVKLPVETVLRRAQVSYLLKRARGSTNHLKIESEKQLVVKFAGYSGLFSTPLTIVMCKGDNSGVEALFRGWRVGVLNVIGSWGLKLLQDNYDKQISTEEKF